MKTNLNLLQTRIACAVALGIASFSDLAAATKSSADTAPARIAIPWSQLGAKAGVDPTFSDANWSSMGVVDGLVIAVVVDNSGNLYIGGSFNITGEVSANHIAKWNGSSWSALGSGIVGGFGDYPSVSALAASGSDLYAGGSFRTAGGSAATNIAKWNGSSWSALGSGTYGPVLALAVSGSDLYAGGAFMTAGGSAAANIAKWDGSSWSALGSGMDGVVRALAVSRGDLYAGGEFTTAGGHAAAKVAKWNGSSWSALGSGIGGNIDASVSALVVSGSNVYAGLGAGTIAKWDGGSWTALGSGMEDGTITALAISGSDLYAGGYFTTSGGSPANAIAKWDGSSWSALGSGLNNYVFALAVSGSDLYAGGSFTTAGGKVSKFIARANLRALPTLSVLRSGENLTVSWPTVDTAGFSLEQASPLAAPAGWVPNSAAFADDGAKKSVTIPATNSSQFFRLRRP